MLQKIKKDMTKQFSRHSSESKSTSRSYNKKDGSKRAIIKKLPTYLKSTIDYLKKVKLFLISEIITINSVSAKFLAALSD